MMDRAQEASSDRNCAVRHGAINGSRSLEIWILIGSTGVDRFDTCGKHHQGTRRRRAEPRLPRCVSDNIV